MRFVSLVFFGLILTGCASTEVYNPMTVASQQELLFNQDGFKAIQDGMTLDQVHKIMGQELIIGYTFTDPNYKPLTIPNPYKSEAIAGTDYVVQYYIDSIREPNGVVGDKDLMPLIFKDGKLVGRGWPSVDSLRPAHPTA